MFSNQFGGGVKTVCAAANMKLAMWVATRFTGYSGEEVGGQQLEARDRTTEEEDRGPC
jgi:hypothetical protein